MGHTKTRPGTSLDTRPSLRLGVGLGLALLGGCGPIEEPAAPAAAQRDQPIIGGADSTQGQFPTVVGLLLDALTIDSSVPLMPKCVHATGACTGTLIREDVILTASHCVSNLLKDLKAPGCDSTLAPPQYSFEVDLIGAARGMRVVATAKAFAHPMFAPSMCTEPPSVSKWNDIALVFLKDPVKGVPLQKLARPADAAALLKEGSKVRIVGYGKSKIDDDKTAGVQRVGTATLVKVGDSEIQAGQMGEQQACQGDSGGPVFANPDGPPDQLVQIGVASRLRTAKCPGLLDIFNPPKCENGVFYTRLDPYYEWIQQTIEKERPTPMETRDMRGTDAPDLGGEAPDLAPGEEPPPEDKGCKCSVGRGAAGSPSTPGLLAGLAFGALLVRRRLRRRG